MKVHEHGQQTADDQTRHGIIHHTHHCRDEGDRKPHFVVFPQDLQMMHIDHATRQHAYSQRQARGVELGVRKRKEESVSCTRR